MIVENLPFSIFEQTMNCTYKAFHIDVDEIRIVILSGAEIDDESVKKMFRAEDVHTQLLNGKLYGEWFGNCAFVFKGVSYSKRSLIVFTPSSSGGREYRFDIEDIATDLKGGEEYSLEGILQDAFELPFKVYLKDWIIRAQKFEFHILNPKDS